MKARKFWTFITSTALGSVGYALILTATTGAANARRVVITPNFVPDNVAVFRLFEQDQSDRLAVVEGTKQESEIREEEKKRLNLTLDLIHSDRLSNGNDFYRAATLLLRSDAPENILLAHDLALTALTLGAKDAAAIAASAEDRFLLTQGLSQRFGTQYQRSKGSQGVSLAPVDNGVTDTMRTAIGISKLSESYTKASTLSRVAMKSDTFPARG